MDNNTTGFQNELWATMIIKELVHHGVRYFCLSPGSRSTPLVEVIAKHPLAETMIHYDERGMAYHALGYVKGSGKPAAILTSSGTAVANLLPAVIEASMQQLPLVVLTADRPPELRDVGANQTMDQVKIFGDYVRWQVDMPCPDVRIPMRYVGTTISQAMSFVNRVPNGPVHVNCMFREPFFCTEEASPVLEQKTSYHSQIVKTPTKFVLKENSLNYLAEELISADKGLILVGSLTKGKSLDNILSLAKRLKWPIFPDILSNMHSNVMEPELIRNFDLVLKSISLRKEIHPKAILQFGERFVSKQLFQWLNKFPPNIYCHITPHPVLHDPIHRLTDRIECTAADFCENIIPKLTKYPEDEWINFWKLKSEQVETHVSSFFNEKNVLSEPYIFHELSNHLSEKTALYIGNSMPIRDADAFLSPKSKIGPIFGNRGVSGIDGNIGTTIGIAAGCEKPLIAVLGDLTFLHDLNSLAQLRQSKVPVIYIVINNQGGGIFSFLPIANKKECFEPFFGTPHPYEFKHAANLFKLPYFNPESTADFSRDLQEAKERNQSCLIEITTDRALNHSLHKEIGTMLTQALASKHSLIGV